MYSKHKKPKTQNIEERNIYAAKGKLQPFLTLGKKKQLQANAKTCLKT